MKKIQISNKIVPLEKSQLEIPLEELSQEELESIYYCDIADAQLQTLV